jgi:GTP cyclohydrolase II
MIFLLIYKTQTLCACIYMCVYQSGTVSKCGIHDESIYRAGVIVYFRKEGRALGEVTKYLVYNLRKRQEGGDSAAEYFNCTQAVAGIQDVRFQALMPDALHWLGITKIDKFVSMSDMKYDAIVNSVRWCCIDELI